MADDSGQQPQQQQQQQQQQRVSLLYLLRHGYDDLVNAIIRPPRAEYDVSELGPQRFRMGPLVVQRTDFEVVNKRGQRLQCSWWEPAEGYRYADVLSCVIYLHGNCGCRIEALEVLRTVISCGMTLVGVDMSGSGLSEGEFISLGLFEQDDVDAVVQHLRSSNRVSCIGLWGRSMGAATALLHAPRDPSIGCLVLDSPFSSMARLASEIARTMALPLPSFAISAVRSMLRSSVRKRAGFDIDDLEPIAKADKSFIPALFAHGEDDVFISPLHSDDIFKRYAGDKERVRLPGDHNAARPPHFFSRAAAWLQRTLMSEEEITTFVQCQEGGFPRPQQGRRPPTPRGLAGPVDAREGSVAEAAAAASSGGTAADEQAVGPDRGQAPTPAWSGTPLAHGEMPAGGRIVPGGAPSLGIGLSSHGAWAGAAGDDGAWGGGEEDDDEDAVLLQVLALSLQEAQQQPQSPADSSAAATQPASAAAAAGAAPEGAAGSLAPPLRPAVLGDLVAAELGPAPMSPSLGLRTPPCSREPRVRLLGSAIASASHPSTAVQAQPLVEDAAGAAACAAAGGGADSAADGAWDLTGLSEEEVLLRVMELSRVEAESREGGTGAPAELGGADEAHGEGEPEEECDDPV